MSVVLDASAILVFLQGETGSQMVEDSMGDSPICGAANWSQVAHRVRGAGRELGAGSSAPGELRRSGRASHRRRRRMGSANHGVPLEGLSLADRLCLAVAERVDADVLTADATWGTGGRIRQIR